MSFEVLSDAGSDAPARTRSVKRRARLSTGFMPDVNDIGEWVLLTIIIFIAYNPLVAQHIFGEPNSLLQAGLTATFFCGLAFLMRSARAPVGPT